MHFTKLTLCVLVAVSLGACESHKEGPAETAGRKLDETGTAVKESAEKASANLDSAAKQVKKDIEGKK